MQNLQQNNDDVILKKREVFKKKGNKKQYINHYFLVLISNIYNYKKHFKIKYFSSYNSLRKNYE